MRFITIIFFNLILLGCVSNHSDMSNFTINDFQKVAPRCDFRSQCKIVELSYETCGFYDPMVYSTKKINSENEKVLLRLASINVEKSKKKVEIEECNGAAKPPPVGVCRRNRCEIIYKWQY